MLDSGKTYNAFGGHCLSIAKSLANLINNENKREIGIRQKHSVHSFIINCVKTNNKTKRSSKQGIKKNKEEEGVARNRENNNFIDKE